MKVLFDGFVYKVFFTFVFVIPGPFPGPSCHRHKLHLLHRILLWPPARIANHLHMSQGTINQVVRLHKKETHITSSQYNNFCKSRSSFTAMSAPVAARRACWSSASSASSKSSMARIAAVLSRLLLMCSLDCWFAMCQEVRVVSVILRLDFITETRLLTAACCLLLLVCWPMVRVNGRMAIIRLWTRSQTSQTLKQVCNVDRLTSRSSTVSYLVEIGISY